MKLTPLFAALVFVSACTEVVSPNLQTTAPVLKFVALGDAPYDEPDKIEEPYRSLIRNVNETAPPLVVHVGDTHGLHTCDDALLDRLRGFMNEFAAPVLYTPGDNEWTDCRRADAGPFDPLDRLAYIRETYFHTGKTLGQEPMAVENQASDGYPENARLMLDNVGFITVHVVGSNNNFNPKDLDAVKEFMARNGANTKWLSDSFDAFAGADAIVVALHADMFTPISGFQEGWWPANPFRDIGVTLGKRSSALEKPVLLLYGDSHEHKVFQPFPERRPYLHAIEVFGYPDIKAIEIEVRPASSSPFSVSKEINQ